MGSRKDRYGEQKRQEREVEETGTGSRRDRNGGKRDRRHGRQKDWHGKQNR